MKVNRYVTVGILTAVAILVGFIVWQQEHIVSDLVANLAQFGKPKVEILPAYLVKTKDHAHLGYSKRVYEKTGFVGSQEGSVLVAISVVDERAFGGDRGFQEFYNLVLLLDYPAGMMNLAIYCGSQLILDTVYSYFDVATLGTACYFNRITVLYAPFLQLQFHRSDHRKEVQVKRRRMIARGRNFVFSNALQEEQYTLWIDADIVSFDQKDMLKRFVESGKYVIVPRVAIGGNPDYDLNTWAGTKSVPSTEQLQLMDQNKWEEAAFFQSEDVPGKTYHLSQQLREIEGLPETDAKRDLSYLVPIDSVGGAVLFVKSILFKQGVVFPTYNVVGTTWQRTEGYDGIETEGLCYLARTIGYLCWAMPNLVAQHITGDR